MMNKKKDIVFDNDVVDHVNSITNDDDYSKRFMKMNSISELNASTMSEEEEVDIPIICLDDDDDDDDDDLKVNKDYKLFLDHLKNDNKGPLLDLNLDHPPLRYETDSGKSETRKLKIENSMKNRVSEQRKKKSRLLESIQRDNRIAERRRKRLAEVEGSRAVPLVRNRESFRGENNVKKFSELKGETLGDSSLVRTEEKGDKKVSERRKRKDDELKGETLGNASLIRTEEEVQRENNVAEGRMRKSNELKGETLRDASLIRTEEEVQRDNKVFKGRMRKANELKRDASLIRTEEDVQRENIVSEVRKRKANELKAETLRKVGSLIRTEEDVQRDNNVSEGRKRKADDLKAETSRKVGSLVGTQEDVQRDNGIAELRKRRIVETKDVNEASKVVPVEVKAVNETSRIAKVTERNKGGFAVRRRNEEGSEAVVDKDYMRYLTWLVDSLKDFTTKPMENLQKDPSDLDSPTLDTLNEPVMVPEEDLLAEVKVEQDLESLSDDSDIIAVSDSPFFDGEGTPFVSSKSVVVDLEKESKKGESSCWFRNKLLEDLKRPYNEAEFSRLYREASIHRKMTRCRELRKGREADYETDTLGKSYLEKFSDFGQVYKRVDRRDKARALELLRGFFFYLKNVSHDGAFKPWMDS